MVCRLWRCAAAGRAVISAVATRDNRGRAYQNGEILKRIQIRTNGIESTESYGYENALSILEIELNAERTGDHQYV